MNNQTAIRRLYLMDLTQLVEILARNGTALQGNNSQYNEMLYVGDYNWN